MRCPNCGQRDTRVVDSRELEEPPTIRRRRECAACSTRFTTYERVDAARLSVVKRDGRREEFDRDKLLAGFRKSLARRPVPRHAAEAAADEIESLLRSRGVNEVPSNVIGELAMEKLRALDQIAYMRFALVYQSFEDLGQLKREVDSLLAGRPAPTPGQTQLALDLEQGATEAGALGPAATGKRSRERRGRGRVKSPVGGQP